MNNEPKSAQVCIVEYMKVWPKVSVTFTKEQKAEYEQRNTFLQNKIDMERLKVDVIGNLNEYAFIQGSEIK